MTQPIDIHVHIHEAPIPRTFETLQELSRQLATLLAQGAETMAKIEDVRKILTQIDTATNEIASDLESLRGRVAAGGLSPQEAQEIADALGAHATRLEAMGKDPDNPAPNPQEPPPPAPPA